MNHQANSSRNFFTPYQTFSYPIKEYKFSLQIRDRRMKLHAFRHEKLIFIGEKIFISTIKIGVFCQKSKQRWSTTKILCACWRYFNHYRHVSNNDVYAGRALYLLLHRRNEKDNTRTARVDARRKNLDRGRALGKLKVNY